MVANPNLKPGSLYERSRPDKDVAMYRAWSLAHPWCQCCGVPAAAAEYPGLSVHHIVKQGRAHEATNLIKLCHLHHRLAEGDTIRGPVGTPLPLLTLGVCLTLKATREPGEFDPARLAALRGRPLPPFAPVPAEFEAAYRRRRPRDAHLFYDPPPEPARAD